ncbi:hypothetical protein QJQ45_024867 [Haematococcus lacustris]|nr:hypothetical protein QJQ45_024867 [Haematococcus lacustris]
MRILTSAYHSFVKNCRTFTTAAPGNSQFVTWPAGLAAGGIWAIVTVVGHDILFTRHIESLRGEIRNLRGGVRGDMQQMGGDMQQVRGAIRKLEASVIRELRIAREEQYKHQVKMGEQMALLGEQMAMVLSKLGVPATQFMFREGRGGSKSDCPAAAAQETTAAAAKTVVAQATAKQPAAVKTYGNHTTTNHHAAR